MSTFITAKYVERRWVGEGLPPPAANPNRQPTDLRAQAKIAVGLQDGYFAHNPFQQPQLVFGAARKAMTPSKSTEAFHNADRKNAPPKAPLDFDAFANRLTAKPAEEPQEESSAFSFTETPAEEPSAFSFTEKPVEEPSAFSLTEKPVEEASAFSFINGDDASNSEIANETVKAPEDIPAPPKPKPKPKADYPATGSTAREIMEQAAAGAGSGPKKQSLFGAKKGKGVARFMKKPGPAEPASAIDQMLFFAGETGYRPVSAPVRQALPAGIGASNMS
jgi:hypothetical protein